MITTQALLDEASPIAQRAGSAFYFAPETVARGKELGIDGFRFYFLGRGGVLGDVEAPVVSSAFGYFEPGLVAHMWNTARRVLAPREAARAYLECAHDMGRERLAGVAGLDEYCDAASAVVSAADPDGLTLFAGILGEPVPGDPPGRAVHLTVALREMRGSAHLLALRASGLATKVAHYLKRPTDFELFGWKKDDIPAARDDERRKLVAAEALTDELVAPAYSVLDVTAREAFLGALRVIGEKLSPREPATAG